MKLKTSKAFVERQKNSLQLELVAQMVFVRMYKDHLPHPTTNRCFYNINNFLR